MARRAEAWKESEVSHLGRIFCGLQDRELQGTRGELWKRPSLQLRGPLDLPEAGRQRSWPLRFSSPSRARQRTLNVVLVI